MIKKGGQTMTNLILTNNFGVTEKKGIPVVNSLIVAEKFSKEHKSVTRSIENSEASENFNKRNFVPIYYKDVQGRKQLMYEMTRDGFSFIAMGFTGKKAAKFKEDYINAFNQMESFIKNLLEAKADFPEFTDAIMEAHDEPKHYHFSNELNMINQIVTGMTAKKFKEVNGLEGVNSIRPYLTPQQLESVKALQRIDIGLIYTVPEYDSRKAILERQHIRIGQKRLSA